MYDAYPLIPLARTSCTYDIDLLNDHASFPPFSRRFTYFHSKHLMFDLKHWSHQTGNAYLHTTMYIRMFIQYSTYFHDNHSASASCVTYFHSKHLIWLEALNRKLLSSRYNVCPHVHSIFYLLLRQPLVQLQSLVLLTSTASISFSTESVDLA